MSYDDDRKRRQQEAYNRIMQSVHATQNMNNYGFSEEDVKRKQAAYNRIMNNQPAPKTKSNKSFVLTKTNNSNFFDRKKGELEKVIGAPLKYAPIEKENNFKKISSYIGKQFSTGAIGGVTGIGNAIGSEYHNNLSKGKEQGFWKSVGDFAGDLVSTPYRAIATPFKTMKKTGEILTDKDKNIWQKAGTLATELPNDMLDSIPTVHQAKKIGQVIGAAAPKLDDVVVKADEYINKPHQYMQEKRQEESQDYSKGVQIAGNVANSIGNMLPSIAASAYDPALGLAVLGTSAKGQATKEALEKGADLDTAIKIGNVKGIVEVGTEKLTGGINIFGKGALDDIVEKGIMNKVKSNVGKFLLKQGYDFAGEVGEEAISDIVGTMVDKGTVDPNATYSIKDLGETATTTLLTTAVLKALGVPMGQLNKYINENQTQNNTEAQKNISENDNKSNLLPKQVNNENNDLGQQSIQMQNENALNRNLEGQKNDFKIQNLNSLNSSIENNNYKYYNDIKIGETRKIPIDEALKLQKSMGYRTQEQIEGLKEYIKNNGLDKSPIELVRKKDGSIEIEDGNHRLQIAQELGIKDIPVKFVESWENIGLSNKSISSELLNEIGGLYDDSIAKGYSTVNETDRNKQGSVYNNNEQYQNRGTAEEDVDISSTESYSNEQTSSNGGQGNNFKQIDFTRKINKESAIDKYNAYKQNILKGRADEVNTLIKNKNEAINSLEQKIAEKRELLEQKVNKDTVEANKIKMYIGTLQQRINRIENEYNSRIDRKNDKITKENIKLQLRKETKTTRKDIQQSLLEKTGLTNENFDDAKNITMINLNRTSPERVNEKVFGHELGTKVNEEIIHPEKHNEAEKTRFKNKEREDIKSWGIKDHSKESAALQKYAEKKYVNEDGKEVTYTENDLRKDIKDEKTRAKIRNAAKELRAKYDSYIDTANEVLVNLGYDPIPKRQDYVRHFNELNDIFTRFGIPGKIQNENALPTDINGITDTFLPGKSYFANTQKRQGIKTTYDAITGIDGYIEGISNLIYHTEDIQRLRAFEKHIRETYGEPGWLKMEGLTEEQKAKRMQNIENNHLSNYAAWLTEYTNNLAGKKSGIDRSVEKLLGRNIYSVLNNIKKQVGSNMTGFNVSSALSNFVSVIQGGSKTNKIAMAKGTLNTFKNIFAKDDFINKSDFLTNRFGSDRISKSVWEKASNAGQVFMNGTDYFTANLIVRSKYYENLSKGMSESDAIKKADDFGARIMGDRSLGATPVIFNSKSLGVVTQFQFEVFNQYDSMIHDTIQDFKVTKDNKGALRASMGAVWSLGQLMAFSYFFNNAYEAVLGNRPAFDAIDIIRTAFGLDDDDDDDSEDSWQNNLQQASKKLIEGLPIINLFSENARIPTASGIPNPIKLVTGDSTLKDEAKKLIYLLPPTGGNQVKKTYQGAKALMEGGSYTTSKNGEKKLQFEVNKDDPGDVVKTLLFGKWAASDARNYNSNPLTEKDQQKMKELGVSAKTFRIYKKDLTDINKIESDKNSEGKSISGSASGKKAFSIMNSDKYSNVEKEFLIGALNSEGSKYKVKTSDLKKLGNSEENYKYFYSLSSNKKQEFMSDMKDYKFTAAQLVKYNNDLKNINDKYDKEKKKNQAVYNNESVAHNNDDMVNDLNSELSQKKKKEISNKILNSKYTDKQKLYLYSKSYNTEDVKLAKTLGINADEFIRYDTQEFTSDYNAKGKAVSGSKQRKIVSYVNNLNLSIPEKAILIKSKSSNFKQYDKQIIEYIDSKDLTTREKESLLKGLGFKISEGRVY